MHKIKHLRQSSLSDATPCYTLLGSSEKGLSRHILEDSDIK